MAWWLEGVNSGILGGFETLQKQFFHIFGAREKIRNFRKNSVFIEKIGDFSPIFFFRFFFPKIVSNPIKNRFFVEKLAEKNDFFVLDSN